VKTQTADSRIGEANSSIVQYTEYLIGLTSFAKLTWQRLGTSGFGRPSACNRSSPKRAFQARSYDEQFHG
jgi:hypothetical protein